MRMSARLAYHGVCPQTTEPARATCVRPDWRRLQRVREQIADGTYLTDDKLTIAVDRLCEELHGNETKRIRRIAS